MGKKTCFRQNVSRNRSHIIKVRFSDLPFAEISLAYLKLYPTRATDMPNQCVLMFVGCECLTFGFSCYHL